MESGLSFVLWVVPLNSACTDFQLLERAFAVAVVVAVVVVAAVVVVSFLIVYLPLSFLDSRVRQHFRPPLGGLFFLERNLSFVAEKHCATTVACNAKERIVMRGKSKNDCTQTYSID